MFKAVKISDNIYWVGAIDYNVRSFHGYNTERGVTYNAYLVIDKQVTLIDSVKAPFTAEMTERIASVIDPSKIDNIICNHAEFDHSGAIKHIFEISGAKVYATAMGIKILTTMYGDMNYVTAAVGQTLNTGKFEFSFLPTPMVHWPDNMVTYLPSEKLLFSNDAFGQHIASSTRFDYEIDSSVILSEAKTYYANIVMPYAMNAGKALDAVKGLQLKTIAPSHGVVLTKMIPDILQLYQQLSSAKKEDTAVIVYDTMWGNTEKLAYKIGAAFESVCTRVIYCNLKCNHLSDIVTEISTAKYLAVGSPTQNNTMLPNVAAFLTYLKGLRPVGLSYAAFGTFGWAGGSIKEICSVLDALKYPKIGEYGCNFVAEDIDLSAISNLK